MAVKTQSSSFSRAKTNKEDEFYTQREDVERELKHYRKHFKGKVVYLNCDDPRVSAFFHFFSYNFEKLGLKKLIATGYRNQERDLRRDGVCNPVAYVSFLERGWLRKTLRSGLQNPSGFRSKTP